MRTQIWIVLSALFIGCGSTPPKSAAVTVATTEKLLKSLKPTYKELFAKGSTVTISYTPAEGVDSVHIFVDTLRLKGNEWVADKTGKINYKVTAYKGSESQSLSGQFTVVSNTEPRLQKIRIVAKYPHQADAYTQGLIFHGGNFFESTGERGRSSIREVDIKSGKILRKRDLDKKYFGEGLALLADKLYQLTWEEGVIFVYDINDFEKRTELPLSGEGWGITTDGTYLYISDGSHKITKYDPDGFRKISQIEVVDNRHTIDYLNELEWIDGKIWANVYTTDLIAVINPQTGIVERYLDCRELVNKIGNATQADVLNGIAYDPKTRRIWLTGKDWDSLFEVTL